MNFSLGKKLEDYVSSQVDNGLFNNASEVVRDALRLHEEHNLKLEALRRDVQQGVDSVQSGRTSRQSAQDIKKAAMSQLASKM